VQQAKRFDVYEISQSPTKRVRPSDGPVIQQEPFPVKKLTEVSRRLNELEIYVGRQARNMELMQIVTAVTFMWCVIATLAVVIVVR